MDFYRDVPEAPGQAAQTRLLLWLGEWFLDIDEGTAYIQGVLGKHSKDLADSTIRDRVLGTQGIVNIESYESAVNPDTRRMLASMTVNTIYGPTQVQIENRTDF